jgi:hypothetical protein
VAVHTSNDFNPFVGDSRYLPTGPTFAYTGRYCELREYRIVSTPDQQRIQLRTTITTALRLGVPRHQRSGTLLRVTEAGTPEELDHLTARLRREAASLGPRPRSATPGHPIARELRVVDSDTAEVQRQGAKVAGSGICSAEGWVLRGLTGGAGYGYGVDVPISVWCSRPAGHNGDHEARIGRSLLHRHELEVARWGGAP